VRHPGDYCFALSNVNDVLYTYSFTVTAVPPSNTPFDLLKAAVTAIQDIGTGASKAAAGPGGCAVNIDDATKASDAVQTALSQLDPGKDANGKTTSVALDTTLSKWPAVDSAFTTFESKVNAVIAQLSALPAVLPAPCSTDKALPAAEAIAIEGYGTALEQYLELAAHVKSQHVARYTTDLDDNNGYDVVVKELKDGQQTTADPKTFHMEPGRSALSSSAGFLLTALPARSYSSRTAPDPSDATKTQNVLGVDYGAGIRPALDALLDYNFPGFILWRQVGLAVTAGPVFDVSGGKADTSKFGFFGGVSLRLSKWVYLTPGVHIGEFADFPEGFTHAGQVIPANTGTPVPNKRYTVRFAFSISFKVKDLTSPASNSQAKTPASQPKSGQ
jgi:hypothetical protein